MSEASMYYELMNRIAELERDNAKNKQRLDAHLDNLVRDDGAIKALQKTAVLLEGRSDLERDKRADQLAVDKALSERITKLEGRAECERANVSSLRHYTTATQEQLNKLDEKLTRIADDTALWDAAKRLSSRIEALEALHACGSAHLAVAPDSPLKSDVARGLQILREEAHRAAEALGRQGVAPDLAYDETVKGWRIRITAERQ